MNEEVPSTRGAWTLVAITSTLLLVICAHIHIVSFDEYITDNDTLIQELRERTEENVLHAQFSSRSHVHKLITETFPQNQWNTAVYIASCESSLNYLAHGDKHLMSPSVKTGELIGDSIGLFQIRTGGSDGGGWDRAHANGMTADEFRQWMFDPIENVKYAYEIWKRQGWKPWSCSGN